MNQIDERLWQASAKEVPAIPDGPFDVVFWMCGGPPPAPFGVEVVDFAIADNPEGTEHFDRLKKLAEAHADLRVLTVCSMGENRSGLMSALTLVARGMRPHEAVWRVQTYGPKNSTDRITSFWNPGFVRQVKELEE